MSNQVKLCVYGSLVLVAMSFAAGRYSVGAPEIKNIEDLKIDEAKTADKDTHKVTTTTTEKQVSGATKTITQVIEDTVSKTQTNTQETAHIDETITPQATNRLNVSGLAGFDMVRFTPVYGASISRQFIGPITVGGFGLTNGILGVSIGINF